MLSQANIENVQYIKIEIEMRESSDNLNFKIFRRMWPWAIQAIII